MRVTVFCAISVDGQIARADGQLDWLDAANATVPPGEDLGFAALMSQVDTLVMGRKTYEKVRSFGEWPYGTLPVVVRSRGPLEIPPELPIRQSAAPITALVESLKQEGKQHLYVDGGQTVQDFLAAGYVSDLILTLIPVLIGQGIPLFGILPKDRPLRLLASTVTPYGFVQLHYQST